MSRASLKYVDELIEQLEGAVSGLDGEHLAIVAIEEAREVIHDLYYENAIEEPDK